MKVKVSKKNSSSESGKSLSLLKQKCEKVDITDGDTESDLENTIGSNIQIISGSFTNLRPMQAAINEKTDAGTSSSNKFAASTPIIYDDITDDEEQKETMDSETDLTFSYENDILQEKKSCEVYMLELAKFVQRTQDMVQEKLTKRTVLLRKVKKYENKIKNLKETIDSLDRMISFGSKVPKLFDEL